MQTQIKKASESMERRVSHMQQEFSEIRAGRANPGVLDKVKVDYYGAPTPVNQLAAVSVTEARTLTVQPWDMSVLRQIEKAILTSDIGINPQNDGKVIRLVFPPLTAVSYTHLRAHETGRNLVCRLLLEKKKA